MVANDVLSVYELQVERAQEALGYEPADCQLDAWFGNGLYGAAEKYSEDGQTEEGIKLYSRDILEAAWADVEAFAEEEGR